MLRVTTFRGYYSFLPFVVGIMVATIIIGRGVSLGQKQTMQALAKQSFNPTVELDTLAPPQVVPGLEIHQETFPSDQNAAEWMLMELSPFEAQQKIDPLLKEWSEREDPDTLIEVVVTLHEDQKFSPLPDFIPNQLRTSETNQAILREREAVVRQQPQQRKASQAGLIQRLQPYGLVVLEHFWITNSFLAKLPAGSVEVVAMQPEVLYIQTRYGGPLPTRDSD